MNITVSPLKYALKDHQRSTANDYVWKKFKSSQAVYEYLSSNIYDFKEDSFIDYGTLTFCFDNHISLHFLYQSDWGWNHVLRGLNSILKDKKISIWQMHFAYASNSWMSRYAVMHNQEEIEIVQGDFRITCPSKDFFSSVYHAAYLHYKPLYRIVQEGYAKKDTRFQKNIKSYMKYLDEMHPEMQKRGWL
jgi:hypothetical protein